MSPRYRRRLPIAFATLLVILIVGGVLGYLLIHHPHMVCGGTTPLATSTDSSGHVTYLCRGTGDR